MFLNIFKKVKKIYYSYIAEKNSVKKNTYHRPRNTPWSGRGKPNQIQKIKTLLWIFAASLTNNQPSRGDDYINPISLSALKMKKGNRRSKRSSIADSSSPSKDESNQPQQNQDCDKRVHDLEKENDALKVTFLFQKLTLWCVDFAGVYLFFEI